MAGHGPAPKAERRRRNAPVRGDWQSSPGVGWQHGPIPPAPDGVHADTIAAWEVWMRSWFASHWTPDDLPGLQHVASLHSQVRAAFHEPFIESDGPRGEPVLVRRPCPATELRQMLDNYGITPKGQQDRRWTRPEAAAEAPATAKAAPSRYAHLRVAQ